MHRRVLAIVGAGVLLVGVVVGARFSPQPVHAQAGSPGRYVMLAAPRVGDPEAPGVWVLNTETGEIRAYRSSRRTLTAKTPGISDLARRMFGPDEELTLWVTTSATSEKELALLVAPARRP